MEVGQVDGTLAGRRGGQGSATRRYIKSPSRPLSSPGVFTTDSAKSSPSIQTRFLFLWFTGIIASFDAELQPVPDLQGPQVAAQGAMNELDAISGHYPYDSDESEDLVSPEALLRRPRIRGGSAPPSSSEVASLERSTGYGCHTAENDCREGSSPGSRQGANKETPIIVDDDSSDDSDIHDLGGEDGRGRNIHSRDVSTVEEDQRNQSGEPDGKKRPQCTPATSDIGSSTLHKNIGSPIFNAPSASPPLIDNSPDLSAEGKEKPCTNGVHNEDGDGQDGDRTATGATRMRASFKRVAETAGLSKDGEGVTRSGKARRTDPIDELDNTVYGQFLAQRRLEPKPVFKPPPRLLDCGRRQNSRGSSPSSGPGDSQDNPLAVEDDDEQASENGGSTRPTSAEPDIRPAYTLSSHTNDEPKTLDCVDAYSGPKSPTESLHPPASPSRAPPQYSRGRVVGEDENGTAVATAPFNASSRSPSQQSEVTSYECIGDEWEIARIVGKRRAAEGDGHDYLVCWTRTYLHESELRNAQRLVQEFEEQRKARRGRKRGTRRGTPRERN